MKFNWKNAVSTIAPTIGKALGGHVGGMAVSSLLDVFGISPDTPNPEKMLAKAVQQATPEQLLALKEAEHKFELRLQELDIDLEEVHANDRDSARTREQKVGGLANPILAGIVITGFFIVVGYVLTNGFIGVDPSAMGLAGTLVGYVSAKADQVISYYFGSSSSSARKTELIRANKNA